MMENFHRAESFGIRVAGVASVDMATLMARKEKILQTQAKSIESLLAHHNIVLVTGDDRTMDYCAVPSAIFTMP